VTGSSAWCVVALNAVLVVFVAWLGWRSDREMRERWRRRDEEMARSDERMSAMHCKFWRSQGSAEHRANCQRCHGHGERGQA